MLLTDDGGSTSASVDFTIGDENLNMGLPILFGEAVCTWFSKLLKKFSEKRYWQQHFKTDYSKNPKSNFFHYI